MTTPLSTALVAPLSITPAAPPCPWLERQGWRRLGAALPPGELETLGFAAAHEAAARNGAWLVPLLGLSERRVALRSHRLLLDTGPALAPSAPARRARRSLLGALGSLARDPGVWTSAALPLLLVEGDLRAAWLAAALPDHAVLGCPPLDPELVAPLLDDTRLLCLRDRRLVLLPAVAGPLSPALAQLADDLAARGAHVHLLGPAPPGVPGQSEPDAAHRPALLALLAAASPWQPPVAETPAGPATRLREQLPRAFWEGPAELVVPHPYVVLDGPGAPLGVQVPRRAEPVRVSSSAFWPIAEVEDQGGEHLLVAIVQRKQGQRRVRKVLLPRNLLSDPRGLCGFLHLRGVNLLSQAESHVAPYLTRFVDENVESLPSLVAQPQSGWDDEYRLFFYGHDPLGGEGVLGSLERDESAQVLFAALRTAGQAEVWTHTAESLICVSPAAALVLAAAIASPMLRLFGWPTIGVLMGALGGAGKSTLLRASASVFGSSGPAGQKQPSGLVAKGTGTPKGLLLQLRRLSDFPHLLDELRPSLHHAGQREDTAEALHQIFEGQEHTRGNRDSNGARVGRPFAGCTVIAGEVAASDFLRKGGVIRRFLVPPAPYATDGLPLGRFARALAQNHGHLGRELVEALVATSPEQRLEMAGRHALYLEGLAVGPGEPEHLRSWCDQIATALAAVDVCAQLCPALCPHPTAWKTAIHAAWRQIREADEGGETGDVLTQIEEKIASWVARHRYHLLPSRALRQKLELRGDLSDRERVLLVPREPGLGQVVEADREGEHDEVLRKVDVFQSALTKFLADEGYSAGTFTGALARRGLIETTAGQSKQGAAARAVRVNGTTVKVYRLVLPAAAPDSQRAA